MTGSFNTAIGNSSGLTLTNGVQNTFLGSTADTSVGYLTNSTAIGFGAIVGTSNTIQLGNSSLANINSTAAITVGGVITGGGFTTGGGISAPGFSVGGFNTSANTIYCAGSGSFGGTLESSNFFTDNSNDIAVGQLFTIGSGNSNISIGIANILSGITTGNHNIALGNDNIFSCSSGAYNIGIGNASLFSCTTGSHNIAIGDHTQLTLIGGESNIALGFQSGYSNITGCYNISIGDNSLVNNQSSFNTAIGYNSGNSNSIGDNNNTYIGSNSNTNGNYVNSTAIGANSIVTASNNIQLGNTSVTSVNTSGSVQAVQINPVLSTDIANKSYVDSSITNSGESYIIWSTGYTIPSGTVASVTNNPDIQYIISGFTYAGSGQFTCTKAGNYVFSYTTTGNMGTTPASVFSFQTYAINTTAGNAGTNFSLVYGQATVTGIPSMTAMSMISFNASDVLQFQAANLGSSTATLSTIMKFIPLP
jgi:hypothetical protein